ncbi:MAG: hypothetical protein IIC78_10835 [Chloroflexi bacterium]|nr:hypothetical protein [Chloroflexota bacterium]
MHNAHTMYLIGKERMADFQRAAEQQRQAARLREQRSGDATRVILGVAARLMIVVGLLVGLSVSA